MTLNDIKDVLFEFDYFRYVALGHNVGPYNIAAAYMEPYLYVDLDISQIQNIIWHGLYQESCVCENFFTKEPYVIDVNQAVLIVGEPDRFKEAAYRLRHLMLL